MQAIRQFIDPLLEVIGKYVPTAIGALIVFLVGILVAKALRRGVAALLEKVGLDRRMKGKTGSEIKAEGLLASIVYYAAVVYVLLLTLGILGIRGVLDPLTGMFDSFLTMLPNLVAAGLIGFLGYVVAKLASGVVAAVSQGLDVLAVKGGLPETFKPAKLLSQIVFILVFAPLLIAALDALKIAAISVPATAMLNQLMTAIPDILAAALILAVAYVVGKFVTGFLAVLLENLGADGWPEKIGLQGTFGKATLSTFCGGLAFFFIMLGAVVSAAEKLGFAQVSVISGHLLAFTGNVVLGMIILGVGTLVANLAHKALGRSGDTKAVASIARVAILGMVLAMGLRAMGIADDIVNLAFLLTLGSVAVTVALAFGLGGREAAGKQMDYWLRKLRKGE